MQEVPAYSANRPLASVRVRAEVRDGRLNVPKLAMAEKRLVELAVSEKKLVVVAEVPVAVPNVKLEKKGEVVPVMRWKASELA